MESKNIKVTLKEGHEFVLQSDAPDIAGLVRSIVQIREEYDPDQITVECEHEGFDKAGFREVLIEATKEFINAVKLEKDDFDAAMATLEASSEQPSEADV